MKKPFNETMIRMVKEMIPRMSQVTRWNGQEVLCRETTAEHSFGVALLAGMVAMTEGADLGKTYHYALWHDFTEIFSGDVNYLFRNSNKEFDNLYEETLKNFSWSKFFDKAFKGAEMFDACFPKDCKELRIVHYCDMLQLLSFCLAEYRKGNRMVKETIDRALAIADERKMGIKCLEGFHIDLLQFVAREMK